jgi:hypothetical protein
MRPRVSLAGLHPPRHRHCPLHPRFSPQGWSAKTNPNSMHGFLARRFTGSCPEGFTPRDAGDMHECWDGDCDESDCCQNGCSAFPLDGCPTGQQRIDSYDQSGCSSLPDDDQDGVGDDCTAETCCFTPCHAWDGTCTVGEKSYAGHIGCGTCCCPVPVPRLPGGIRRPVSALVLFVSLALFRSPCRISRLLRLLLLECRHSCS